MFLVQVNRLLQQTYAIECLLSYVSDRAARAARVVGSDGFELLHVKLAYVSSHGLGLSL